MEDSTLDLPSEVRTLVRVIMTNVVRINFQNRPKQHAVSIAPWSSETPLPSTDLFHATVEDLTKVLAIHFPGLRSDSRDQCARQSATLALGLLNEALPKTDLVDEMVTAVQTYVEAVLKREGVLVGKKADRYVRQGDIYWVKTQSQNVAHPHVVIQDDVLNGSRIDRVVVCGLSTNRTLESEPGNMLLEVGEGGLVKQSVVVVSQVDSVLKSELGDYIGTLDADRVRQIYSGMRFQQRAYFGRS